MILTQLPIYILLMPWVSRSRSSNTDVQQEDGRWRHWYSKVQKQPARHWSVTPYPLLTYSMVQSPSWAADWLAASQEISPHFTEPEGSLPHSQASATCPYPGPAQSSPHPTSWRSILILSTHLCLGLPSGLSPSGFPTKTLYTPPLLTHTHHMPSPSHTHY